MSKSAVMMAINKSPSRPFIFTHSDWKGKHFVTPILYKYVFHSTF